MTPRRQIKAQIRVSSCTDQGTHVFETFTVVLEIPESTPVQVALDRVTDTARTFPLGLLGLLSAGEVKTGPHKNVWTATL